VSRFIITSKSGVTDRGVSAGIVAVIGAVATAGCYWWFVDTAALDAVAPAFEGRPIILPAVLLAASIALSLGAFLVFLVERTFTHDVRVLPDRDDQRP
jgi:uncharacterized membrane protein YdjX (TVP38/TMEM64 family)